MALTIGIPRETDSGEKRVAATPQSAAELMRLGFHVTVESGAGDAANIADALYENIGIEVLEDSSSVWSSDIVLKVRAPQMHEVALLKEGATLISFIWPAQNSELMEALAERKVTVLAMDSVPRISRAQKFDALSSMANIAGYRAVIEAANHFGRFLNGQITAAGKIHPAKVLVIGAGVAGLAAIGTANSMGAIVRAFDTRPEVKEQVESMGAEFLELEFEEDASGEGGYAKVMSKEFIEAEMALFAQQAKEVDIIITTALIPGRPAPLLVTEEMVASMHQGSVIVDLAAENGGNCASTEAHKVVVKEGVTIIGYTDLPSRLPTQSSQLYGTNIKHLLSDLCPENNGQIVLDMDDEVIRGTTVIKEGEIIWPPPAPKLTKEAPKKQELKPESEAVSTEVPKRKSFGAMIALAVIMLAIAGISYVSPPEFLAHFTVFVLACFVGYHVVWSVTPALHTPLMSVTNAISGIIILGALVQFDVESSTLITILSVVAIFVATINISGGFLVTHRMLKMFQKYEEEK